MTCSVLYIQTVRASVVGGDYGRFVGPARIQFHHSKVLAVSAIVYPAFDLKTLGAGGRGFYVIR